MSSTYWKALLRVVNLFIFRMIPSDCANFLQIHWICITQVSFLSSITPRYLYVSTCSRSCSEDRLMLIWGSFMSFLLLDWTIMLLLVWFRHSLFLNSQVTIAPSCSFTLCNKVYRFGRDISKIVSSAKSLVIKLDACVRH